MKKILTIIACVCVLLTCCGIGGYMYYRSGISAVSDSNKEVTVEIKGSPSDIIEQLDAAGLIKDKKMAKLFLKLNSFDTLQANTYIFRENMDLNEIFTVINSGDFQYLATSKMTVTEGSTIPEIAKVVADTTNTSTEDVIRTWEDKAYLQELIDKYWFLSDEILDSDILFPLEGYLYPETYTLTASDITIEDVTEMMLDMSDKVLKPYKKDIEKMGFSVHKFLTFASIVERESLYEKDCPIIAGVFLNRLDIGMKLQSDITVNYAWQRTGVDVSYAHLEIDSRYNTYKYAGLPVGPISNVSERVMEASLHPKERNKKYLYFFALEDGTVMYSKTYEEHMKTVNEHKWY